MMFFLSIFLIISLIVNGILFWYTKKILQKLTFGVDNVQQLQELLEEYCFLLESMLTLDEYYGDDTVTAAVKNTKLVIETCKVYKNTIIEQAQENMSQQDDQPNTK